jgi:hypothetical protein
VRYCSFSAVIGVAGPYGSAGAQPVQMIKCGLKSHSALHLGNAGTSASSGCGAHQCAYFIIPFLVPTYGTTSKADA